MKIINLRSGNKRTIIAFANETTLSFKNKNNAVINIALRAYDNGAAFRYEFAGPSKKITVKKELTEFAIPEGKKWLQNYSMPAQWNPSYEEDYKNGIAVGTPAKDVSGWAFPALFQTSKVGDVKSLWMLITEANAVSEYCGTHLASAMRERSLQNRFSDPRRSECHR